MLTRQGDGCRARPLLGPTESRGEIGPAGIGKDYVYQKPNCVSWPIRALTRRGGLVLTVDRRIFWDNGFKSVAAVANADPNELLPILMQAQPNKVRLQAKDEQKYKDKLLAKARAIADSANRIWRKSNVGCKMTTLSEANRAAEIEMQQEIIDEE